MKAGLSHGSRVFHVGAGMPTFQITGFKSHTLSASGTDLEIVCETKYIGDLALSVPVAAFAQLLAELGQKSDQAKLPPTASPTASATGIAQAQPQISVTQTVKPTAPPPGIPAVSTEYRVQVPRKIIVTADLKQHEVVLMLFEGPTDAKTGYALDAKGAKATAARLIESADVLIGHKASKNQRVQ